jgi:hypothetical protein
LSWVVWATTIGSVAGPNLALTADESVRRYGAAQYSGPFVFSAAAFLVAGVLVFLLLRPDPLLTARSLASTAGAALQAGKLRPESKKRIDGHRGMKPQPGPGRKDPGIRPGSGRGRRQAESWRNR